MRRFRLVPALALALLVAPTAARAQLGVDFTSASDANNGWFSLGWSFNVLTPFSVSGLGFYDAGKDGLNQSHEVGLWTSGGTLLASATVSSSDPLISFWRFATITPVNLGVGSYIISGASHNELYPLNNSVGTVFDSKITYGTDWWTGGDPLVFPTTSNGLNAGNPGWLAVNFLEENPNHPQDIAPEPATMSLLATGLAGLAAAGRRKKILRS
ncbi:MAG: DUF4082 domain-containing protein [Gemmatimonadota bacterium]